MERKVTYVLALVLMLALSSLAQEQAETCTMNPRERINCGFPGVTAQQCKDKGCCFDNTVRGFPWCFHPLAIQEPLEDPAAHVAHSPVSSLARTLIPAKRPTL
ncbi:trefoil factor 1-like [Acomys russatus]|uniref:trefoil factor 1-like n=1 Tax=Acomys russatus TaxID=60746 RepID=UPI0021E275AE|nr:trefoil factor 1-like [Acomys russatus]